MPKANLTVRDLMTTALVTVKETDSIGIADTEMKLGAMRHIPVVDDHQHLVGILSIQDVLTALARGKTSVPAGEFMTRHIISVTSDTSAREALELLLENKIGALPVVEDNAELVGIITETDFLQASRGAFGVQHHRRPIQGRRQLS